MTHDTTHECYYWISLGNGRWHKTNAQELSSAKRAARRYKDHYPMDAFVAFGTEADAKADKLAINSIHTSRGWHDYADASDYE